MSKTNFCFLFQTFYLFCFIFFYKRRYILAIIVASADDGDEQTRAKLFYLLFSVFHSKNFSFYLFISIYFVCCWTKQKLYILVYTSIDGRRYAMFVHHSFCNLEGFLCLKFLVAICVPKGLEIWYDGNLTDFFPSYSNCYFII